MRINTDPGAQPVPIEHFIGGVAVAWSLPGLEIPEKVRDPILTAQNTSGMGHPAGIIPSVGPGIEKEKKIADPSRAPMPPARELKLIFPTSN